MNSSSLHEKIVNATSPIPTNNLIGNLGKLNQMPQVAIIRVVANSTHGTVLLGDKEVLSSSLFH